VDEGSFPAGATRSVAVSGSSTGTGPRSGRRPEPVQTRRTVRLLTLRGLAPAEATNLTAYLCGIPVADRHWSLREINKLLFLRQLNAHGRFGPMDGTA
jgi:hypothetical protein